MDGSPPRSEAAPGVERLWWPRMRWRMRGAWLWPTFALTTLLDGLLLDLLPPYGDGPGGLAPGLLLAGFANLILVAVLAPAAAAALRRRRPDLPRLIATDYAGTALQWALLAALLVGGLAHRPAVVEEERERVAQLAAVHDYLLARRSASLAALPLADTLQLEDDLYRTCLPTEEARRWLCLFVSTAGERPRVSRDADRVPNATYRRPGGFR
jgi:hypothetical protein